MVTFGSFDGGKEGKYNDGGFVEITRTFVQQNNQVYLYQLYTKILQPTIMNNVCYYCYIATQVSAIYIVAWNEGYQKIHHNIHDVNKLFDCADLTNVKILMYPTALT